jgi:hypothetical protein
MSKYHKFAVGWLKENENKGQYVSAVLSRSKSSKNAIKLIAEFADGRQMELTNFAMFFNENKNSENSPDVQFVFNTEKQ